jgi:hypothetical protein
LIGVIDRMAMPLAEQMRERGLARAALFGRERWQQRFADFIDDVLSRPARRHCDTISIEPLRKEYRAVVGEGTLLVPVRLVNAGTHAAVPEGPGRTRICCEVREMTGELAMPRSEMNLPALLLPGQNQVAALPIPLPNDARLYRVVSWTERGNRQMGDEAEIALNVEPADAEQSGSCASVFLDTVQATLPKTHELQQLPNDYIDVTEGRLAPLKRFVKRKLLHNFKHAYVDVMARQQSQVNGQVVLMIQQLAECCAMLDHAVAGLHRRLDALEAKLEDSDERAACGLAQEKRMEHHG